MIKLQAFFWLLLIGCFIGAYAHWVNDYNKNLDRWQPIVERCSKFGGFMNDKGECDYNQ